MFRYVLLSSLLVIAPGLDCYVGQTETLAKVHCDSLYGVDNATCAKYHTLVLSS